MLDELRRKPSENLNFLEQVGMLFGELRDELLFRRIRLHFFDDDFHSFEEKLEENDEAVDEFKLEIVLHFPSYSLLEQLLVHSQDHVDRGVEVLAFLSEDLFEEVEVPENFGKHFAVIRAEGLVEHVFEVLVVEVEFFDESKDFEDLVRVLVVAVNVVEKVVDLVGQIQWENQIAISELLDVDGLEFVRIDEMSRVFREKVVLQVRHRGDRVEAAVGNEQVLKGSKEVLMESQIPLDLDQREKEFVLQNDSVHDLLVGERGIHVHEEKQELKVGVVFVQQFCVRVSTDVSDFLEELPLVLQVPKDLEVDFEVLFDLPEMVGHLVHVWVVGNLLHQFLTTEKIAFQLENRKVLHLLRLLQVGLNVFSQEGGK